MANMTQNLFQKNNNGKVISHKQQREYADDLEISSVKKSEKTSTTEPRKSSQKAASRSHAK